MANSNKKIQTLNSCSSTSNVEPPAGTYFHYDFNQLNKSLKSSSESIPSLDVFSGTELAENIVMVDKSNPPKSADDLCCFERRILVTGGAGFIGSNIVKRLLVQGGQPVVLDDLSSGYKENLLPEVKFFKGDVRIRETVEKAMAGCNVVLHLAASVGNKRSIDDPLTDASINVLGTLNVLEAARKHGIQRIVFSSSAGIFGELKTLPIAEDHPQDPDSPYGTSKLAAEKMCLVYNKLYGMRNVCLRYFNVYGLNQRYDAYGNVIPIFANRILKDESLTIYGDGEQTRDFVNVADVAAANISAAFSPDACGVFNIGSGTRVTINELARLIQEAAGVTVGLEYAPPRPGDVRDSLADISAAQKAFGFNPQTDLKDGLAEYMEWIKEDTITIEQIRGYKGKR